MTREDLTGRTFGRLTVLGKSDKRSPDGRYPLWKCKCSCPSGTIVFARTGSLISGNTKSCGCVNRERLSAEHSVDLTGRIFGRLTVLRKSLETTKNGKSKWVCQCSCPEKTVIEVIVDHLTTGHTQSCGCLHRDVFTKWKNPDELRLSGIFAGMKQRCYNPNNKRYDGWGGRGITICDEWLNNERAFVDWALSHSYKPGYSIDRIDNDGPYAPWNCRWSDAIEQANNTRTNVVIPAFGMENTLSQWSRSTEIDYESLRHLHRSGQDEKLNMLIASSMFFKQLNKLHNLEEKNVG